MSGNTKRFLSLEEQVTQLEKKGVRVDDIQKAKEILYDHNYYTLVSCSKAKFAIDRDTNGKYMYEASAFQDWVNYYACDCKVSVHLMRGILNIERKINSRTAYLISNLLEASSLSTQDRANLVVAIQGHRNHTGYSGIKTWEHITRKTFGELNYIIKWLWENNHKHIVKGILEDFNFLKANTLERLDELVNLRNKIFHFTPLSIYLTLGTPESKSSQYPLRRKIIEYVFHTVPCDDCYDIKQDMLEIFKATAHFRKLKNRKNA